MSYAYNVLPSIKPFVPTVLNTIIFAGRMEMKFYSSIIYSTYYEIDLKVNCEHYLKNVLYDNLLL